MEGHATEDFQQLRLRFVDSIQHDYEVIRPIVLFGEHLAARSRQTDLPRTTIGDKARRFVQQGMLGLVEQHSPHGGRKPHPYPPPVANYILYLKQLYPPIHLREIVRILACKFGYTTNHHTIKRFLARYTLPTQLALNLPTFHQFDDAYQARWTVVRMFYEGWDQRSIAGCLRLSRRHVGRILAAFEQDGFAGLEDQRTRPPDHPHNQLSLPLLYEVHQLQHEHTRAGRFRIHGFLETQRTAQGKPVPSMTTVGRAMAINRRFHGAPPAWPLPQAHDHSAPPTPLPYAPLRPHQYWFIDVRYLVRLDGRWIYSICVLEGYSRKLLAGMASEYQDLVAILQLLCAALKEYGRPEGIVSDNGGAFQAHAYAAFLTALAIEPCFIDKGQPWQNLIETQFLVQARLADANFEQASSLEEIQTHHAAFMAAFNTLPHWAHHDRSDGRRTPEAVLGWVQGRPIDLMQLQRQLREMQVLRMVNQHGFVSVQRFSIYAERGLAKQRVAVWVYEGDLRVTHQQAVLATYQCQFDRRHKRLRTVWNPKLYQTVFASPQLELWELDDTQWRKIVERPMGLRRTRAAARTDAQLAFAFATRERADDVA